MLDAVHHYLRRFLPVTDPTTAPTTDPTATTTDPTATTAAPTTDPAATDPTATTTDTATTAAPATTDTTAATDTAATDPAATESSLLQAVQNALSTFKADVLDPMAQETATLHDTVLSHSADLATRVNALEQHLGFTPAPTVVEPATTDPSPVDTTATDTTATDTTAGDLTAVDAAPEAPGTPDAPQGSPNGDALAVRVVPPLDEQPTR